MASDYSLKKRHMVPNFRRFSDTVRLGELALASPTVPDQVRIDFRSRLTEWNIERTVGLAGDIVSAALVSSETDLPVIDEAATFIVDHPDICSSSLTSTAHRVLTRDQTTSGHSVQLPRLTTFLENNSRHKTYKNIHDLKNAATRFGSDPILFTELARLYLIVGNEGRAKRNIAIAVSLAPSNRYVLRSAVRLYAHCDEAERGFDLLYKNPCTRHDPWLASAELAMAGLIEKNHLVFKSAGRTLTSDKFSPSSLTELQAGVGSVALLNGDRRRCKRLFQASIQYPNDNSLAQVEWGLSKDRLFDLDLSAYKVSRNYEALALEAFNQEQWTSVLRHCEDWLMDTPFTSRPAGMASHVASVILDDFTAAKSFCQASRVASPDDPLVANNYAYALALDGQPREALEVLDKLKLSGGEEARARVCLTATRGLAYFRSGRINEGREKYETAIESARSIDDLDFRQMAILNYAREELIAKQLVPASFADGIRDLKIGPRAVATQILKDKVVALLDAASAASGRASSSNPSPGGSVRNLAES